MQLQTFVCIFVIGTSFVLAKEPELPLCPTNINYFPQTLPMHCRMPRSANYPMFPGMLPNLTFPPLPPVYQGPPDKQPAPMPIPVPPGMPGPVPMPMHVPMMPMQPPGPAHKLPVIVMPFYSPEPIRKPSNSGRHTPKKRRVHNNKKRLPHYHTETDTDTDTDTSETDTSRDTSGDTSSSDYDAGWWRGRKIGRRSNGKHLLKRRKQKKNKELLTPILQYVTKDGYVIFEKKISKNQASDWLQEKQEDKEREFNAPPKEINNDKDEEEAIQEVENATKEVAKNRGTDTKIFQEMEQVEVKTHRNPHRHKPKKSFKDKS
ncbi:unnamed protein product [Parnassius apollo]|uniref:(apollo) hypothetical protein n=1 Tax=Parnassius apollo TaxID=110799 RepID=A0A8S3XP53_PARAO|nr:unnamed protein product [Parnassius apollo]